MTIAESLAHSNSHIWSNVIMTAYILPPDAECWAHIHSTALSLSSELEFQALVLLHRWCCGRAYHSYEVSLLNPEEFWCYGVLPTAQHPIIRSSAEITDMRFPVSYVYRNVTHTHTKTHRLRPSQYKELDVRERIYCGCHNVDFVSIRRCVTDMAKQHHSEHLHW